MVTTMAPRICVLGAGVVGLTTAVCLMDSESDVTLIAETFSPHTTSDGSAGFWTPLAVNEKQSAKITKWGKDTYKYFLDLFLSKDAATCGVQLVSGYNFSSHLKFKDPPWKDSVLGYRSLTEEEIKGYQGKTAGVFFTSISVDMSKYLKWLLDRFKHKGGKVVMKRVNNLQEVADHFDIVVNCTGLGARQLVKDETVTPIRGQTIRVKAPWIKHFYMDWDTEDAGNITYLLPNSESTVIGGTAQSGNWNTEIDPRDRSDIWSRSLKLLPSLKDAEVIREWTGLRPARTEVRLEIDKKLYNKCQVIHNYGHGGAGVTLCWGCAVEARGLVAKVIMHRKTKAKL